MKKKEEKNCSRNGTKEKKRIQQEANLQKLRAVYVRRGTVNAINHIVKKAMYHKRR